MYQSNARVSCMHSQLKRKFRMNAIQLHFCYKHKQLTNNDAQHNMCMCRTCNRLPQGLMRSFWYQLSEFRAFFPSLCDCSTICLNELTRKSFSPKKNYHNNLLRWIASQFYKRWCKICNYVCEYQFVLLLEKQFCVSYLFYLTSHKTVKFRSQI